MKNYERIPTGIKGLDPLIEGGFPQGSLILVAGNPGVGKTIFGAEFLHTGATKFGQKGVYVSFAEGRENFNENMLRLGLDFEKLEESGKIRVLDLVTVKEAGMETVMEMIASEIQSLGAERLVIDSFSALTCAFDAKINVRILIHILSKMIRQAGCTTLLVTEIPTGNMQIGFGIEEFVADGILILRRVRIEDRLAREMEMVKLRGTKLEENTFFFSLEDGFQVFSPFKPKIIGEARIFEPIPDSETHFSTGIPSLDKVLHGGYPRGSVVLLEIGPNLSMSNYHLLIAPTGANFLAQKRGVMIAPTIGVDADYTLKVNRAYGFGEEIYDLLRVVQYPTLTQGQSKPYILTVEAKTLKEGYVLWKQAQGELREKTGQPVLEVVGVDALASVFGEENVKSMIALAATNTRHQGNLIVVLVKPGMEDIACRIANISEIHLKLMREHGTLLLFGQKPRTGLYVMEMDVSRGFPLPKLTPIY